MSHHAPHGNLVSRELTAVYSPIDSRSGERIVASGIKTYLWRRDLGWMCFCALKTGRPHCTRIVDVLETGQTFVFCHYYPSRCNFSSECCLSRMARWYLCADKNSQFNRNEADRIYRLCILELADRYSIFSSFNISTFLLISIQIVLHGAPDMQKLINEFRNRTVIFGNSDDVVAPYFAGYCGSHASVYAGLRQLGGELIQVPRSLNVLQRRASVTMIPGGSTFGSRRRASKRRDDSDSGMFSFKPSR